MLTKILVTALVILACYTYIRYQRRQQMTLFEHSDTSGNSSEKNTLPLPVRWLAGGLVVLVICTAISFFVYDWLDSRRILTVKVTSPQSGEMVNYLVYKGDLNERSFETIQGQVVRIGNSERIEVSETP